MSLDAIEVQEQLKLSDKSKSNSRPTLPPFCESQRSHHRHHHRQVMTTRKSHGGVSEEETKSLSASSTRRIRLRSAADEHHCSLRAAAVADVTKTERSGKMESPPNAAAGRNCFPAKSISCNKSSSLHSGSQALEPGRQQDNRRSGAIRSSEPRTGVRRTSVPTTPSHRKSSASLSLPNSSSSEANTMTIIRDARLLQQLQDEKPFRISPMGYDSRYEDLIYESQHRCPDEDDIAPEQTKQAIDKCKLWLKKHHVDTSGRRANHL